MSDSKLKKNAVVYLIIAVATLTALIAYFFLPGQIPMQWNGTEVIWYADKIAIFSVPLILILVAVFFGPRFLARVNESASSPHFGEIILIGSMLIFFSTEVYTILYCYGFRWRLEYIVVTEFMIMVIVFIAEILKPIIKIWNRQP